MDKLNFDINQFLRFLLSGGWAITCYLFINPNDLKKVLEGNGVDLIILALVIGSMIYIIHRAVIYPNIFKFLRFVLWVCKRRKWEWGYIIPFFPTNREIREDFIRWAERQKKNSVSSKNIIEWGSQVHFLFCSAWVCLLVIFLSKELGGCMSQTHRIVYIEGSFWILLISGLINNLRLILYDMKSKEMEKELS